MLKELKTGTPQGRQQGEKGGKGGVCRVGRREDEGDERKGGGRRWWQRDGRSVKMEEG
jgi:hypothetical protein